MGEIVAEIFFKYIIAGIWIGLNSIFDWFKGVLFGVPKIEVLDSSHKCNITLIVDDCRKNLVGGHEPMSFSGSVV